MKFVNIIKAIKLMNENINIINNISIKEDNPEKYSDQKSTPIKLIKTNRAECQHMKDEVNFNLSDFIVEDFFNNEKAIKLREEENKVHEKERDKIFFNFMQVVKCLQKVPNNANNKNNNKKNLYDYFTSEEFNIDSLMVHLNKQNKISIIDTLVEIMYKKYINQSFFYLPQLTMFFNFKEYYKPLESYLLDRCVDQIKFSLQITWLLNSYVEDDYSKIKLDVYDELLQKIEETLVNGQRNTMKVFDHFDKIKEKDSEENIIRINNLKNNDNNSNNSFKIEEYTTKQNRLTYFNICKEFYASLKYMCEDLKNFDKENGERKNKLMDYIKDFNQKLIDQRNNNEEFLKLYPSLFGIILPFNDTSSTDDIESNYIVRLIPEECFCFSTKARVPTKICAECITLKDLQNSGLLNCKNSSTIDKKKSNFFCGDKNIIINKYSRKNVKRMTQQTSGLKILFQNRNENNSGEIKNDKMKKRSSGTFIFIKEGDEGNTILDKEKYQKEKLKQFLIETSELANKKDIKINQNNNDIIKDFEILPDITEELKNVFGKPIDILQKEMKQNSPYKNFKSYKLINFIAKADDDLRQELLAMQLIKFFDKIFKKENILLKLHPYEILITSSNSGLLEFLQNTSSIDGIKKKMQTESKSLYLFYKKYFKENFEEAQINFTRSLAAYSLVCYYLKIKDRHNGNILIDMYGNIIHIDFGFILGISPGGINFENAPFKLTKEYVEIMGGVDSLYYQMYKDLMVKGMIACKKYVDDIVNIAEIMSKGSKMPCFYNKNLDDIFKRFRERFYQDKKDEEFIKIVDEMIDLSYDNFRTNQYDNYQKLTNGIIP